MENLTSYSVIVCWKKKIGAAGLQSAPGAAPAWINDTSSWKLRSGLQLRGASDENDARRRVHQLNLPQSLADSARCSVGGLRSRQFDGLWACFPLVSPPSMGCAYFRLAWAVNNERLDQTLPACLVGWSGFFSFLY